MTNAELTQGNRRILVVDDNRAIHEDFRKILLASARDRVIDETEAALFDEPQVDTPSASFEIDSAYQGEEAWDLVRKARTEQRSYAMAFIDVRMPPG